jgi:4-hydroxybenzoate polyprenyltransferase
MARPGAYLQLMRPVNLGILLLMQLLLLGKGSGWNAEMLRLPECIWVALAILATAAAGNVINDIYDTATDAVNKPGKQLVPKVIPQKNALLFYCVLLAISLFSAWFTDLGFFLFCAAVSLLLFYYTRELKGIPIAGNLLIALLTAAAVFSTRHGLYDTTLIPFAELSALAFFVNLSRELVKDVEDLAGDRAAGILTFAVRFGHLQTYRLAALVLFPAALLAMAPVLFVFESLLFRMHYAIAAAGLLWISIVIYRTNTPAQAGRLSRYLKLALFWGLLGTLWL